MSPRLATTIVATVLFLVCSAFAAYFAIAHDWPFLAIDLVVLVWFGYNARRHLNGLGKERKL